MVPENTGIRIKIWELKIVSVVMNAVSVGICAHNEEDTIGTLVEQVLDEEIPLDDVFVVATGDDRTVDIVREKSRENDEVVVIEEEEREGQSAAQNRILKRNSAETLFLVDGDGTIEPGSLEIMMERYDGESILYGREVPVTDGSIMGVVTDLLWELHHSLSVDEPKFSTQLGLIPSDLVNRIPPDIVLDDEYIGVKARVKDMDIGYVPEAVKIHNTRTSLRFYFNQRRKNWAGRRQIEKMGYENLQSTGTRVSHYLGSILRVSPFRIPLLLLLGAIELAAVGMAMYDSFTGEYPYIWYR